MQSHKRPFVSDIVKLYHHWSIASESPFNPHPTPASVSGSHPYLPFLWLMCLSGRPFLEDGTHIFFKGFCVSSRVRLLPHCSVLFSITLIIFVVSTHERPLPSVRTKDRAKNVMKLVENGPTVTARRDAQIRHFTVMPRVHF